MIRIGREIQCLPYAGFFFYRLPPKKNIGPMIRIGREIQCLLYAGFFKSKAMSESVETTTGLLCNQFTKYLPTIRSQKIKYSNEKLNMTDTSEKH